MTQEEFVKHLNFAGGNKFKISDAKQAGEAECSFPCYIGTGERIYLGHYDEGKWYKHGFTSAADKYDYLTASQIQTEEEISDVEWYYKIK